MRTQSTSRRRFLAQTSLAAAAILAPRRSLFAQLISTTLTDIDPAIVSTPCGSLRGELTPEGIRIFRGIPFAQPPIGPLRFQPPQNLAPWSGTRDALKFAASPIQSGERNVDHSEDCLALNVWAPTTKGPHSVFVWIHGGGYTGGHSFSSDSDGTVFARDGIVFVSVAYRLGVLGFLDVEPLLGGAYTSTANNALRDLIASLQWVQKNIASFGGDPTRVTIGGESAGAKLTDILMGTPSAQPLFHQMISESGGAERILPKTQSITVAQAFAQTWTANGASIASLPTATPEDLIAAQQRFIATYPQHFPLRPEVDGSLVPRLPVETIAAGSTRGKRLLIGTNLDESASFIGPHPARDATATDLGNLALDHFQLVYPKYAALYPDLTEEQRRIRAVTAEEYWLPSTRVVDAHVKGGGSAFMYRLDFTEISGRYQGYAEHSMDIPMVFSQSKDAAPGAKAALSQQMHAAWSAFIKGETPAAPGLPTWPPYTAKTRATMVLNSSSHIEQRPHDPELKLWDGTM